MFYFTIGWKPRRTILFCSWDAEEYGLIGSNEWVEVRLLRQRMAFGWYSVDRSLNYTLNYT